MSGICDSVRNLVCPFGRVGCVCVCAGVGLNYCRTVLHCCALFPFFGEEFRLASRATISHGFARHGFSSEDDPLALFFFGPWVQHHLFGAGKEASRCKKTSYVKENVGHGFVRTWGMLSKLRFFKGKMINL